MNDQLILEALEALAQHCPWESVDIWVTRQPNGRLEFTAYSRGIDKLDLPSAYGNDDKTPMDAVADLKKRNPDRNPARMRDEKVRELEAQIATLRATDFTLIPYRPRKSLTIGGENQEETPVEQPKAGPGVINVDAEVS